ncbi:MAG: metal ABC transporter permease [Smithellaceae bacterium]|nr:metal ABC transporter permease [Smithellaceae bacterium]
MEFISFGFIQRALLAGSFIGILCSVLGVFLVLRRLSLIGDGLAHATFGSVAIAIFFHMPVLSVSVPLVAVCSLGILKLTERMRLYGDAAIAVVSSLGIAVGVMISSAAGGFNIDLFSYLFGSILSITASEVATAIVLSVIVVVIVLLYYNDLLSLSFDEDYARASGINAGSINTVFIVLTAVTVVLTMKVVGIMLVSALLVLPAVTALQLARSFSSTMMIAAATAVISIVSGITVSYFLDLPAGATIVVINLTFFILALLIKKILKMRDVASSAA